MLRKYSSPVSWPQTIKSTSKPAQALSSIARKKTVIESPNRYQLLGYLGSKTKEKQTLSSVRGSLWHNIQSTAARQMQRHPQNVSTFHWFSLWPRLILSNLILTQALDDLTRSGIITWMGERWHGKQHSYDEDTKQRQRSKFSYWLLIWLLTDFKTSRQIHFDFLNNYIFKTGTGNSINLIIFSWRSAGVSMGSCTNSRNLWKPTCFYNHPV